MKLNFERKRIETLLNHTKKANEWKPLYEQAETAKPGLWLVGDQGIYFMANTVVPLVTDQPKKSKERSSSEFPGHYVCYAEESNPDKGEFDYWYGNKRAAFGGDDGGEFIPASEIEEWLDRNAGPFLVMLLEPGTYALEVLVHPPKPKKEKKIKLT